MDLSVRAAPTPFPDEPSAAEAAVAVETLLLGIHDGRLTYRVARQDLPGDEHPDVVARRLAGFAAGPAPAGALLHSTSWRFTAGRIVLTYAALPDPDPGTACTLQAPPGPAQGSAPLEPSPPRVAETDVVAHACRHLAFLKHTDPMVRTASRRRPELWKLLAAYHPDVAGGLVHQGA